MLFRLIIVALLFSSCAMDMSSQNNNRTTEIHTTRGQELIDLKKALDKGAITQEEYEELKEKIMKRKKEKEMTKKKD